MDRSDSDSMLSVVAQDLEKCLQNAIDMAGAYVGRETPIISVARDFDLQKLDAQQTGQLLSMWSQGAISHELLLSMLQRGEILPDIDIDAEIELIESSKLDGLDLQASGGVAPDDDEEESGASEDGEEPSALRAEVERRLKKLAEDDDEDEEN
jgi:hypothetical protein